VYGAVEKKLEGMAEQYKNQDRSSNKDKKEKNENQD
jgi:hypothetical protein